MTVDDKLIEAKNGLLYKYFSINNNSKKVIRDNLLFFSNPLKHFNDPFDCRLENDLTGTLPEWERKLKAIAKDNGIKLKGKELRSNALKAIRKIKDRKFIDDLMEGLIGDIGVFCLTEEKDDILMYSHYGKDHTGMCLGFSIDKQFSKFYFYHDRYLREINYVDTYDPPSYLRSPPEELYFWDLLTKSDRWKYENEWRLVTKKKYGEYECPENLLVDISFGCQVDKMERNEIIEMNKKRKYPARIYDTVKGRRNFSLEREEII